MGKVARPWPLLRSTKDHLGRGVVSGLAGTAVMTVFQKLIEMPLTGRSDSYAPASFAEMVSPAAFTAHTCQRTLNYGTHFALGPCGALRSGLPRPRGYVARRR